jgi:sialate O-acetylesterase
MFRRRYQRQVARTATCASLEVMYDISAQNTSNNTLYIRGPYNISVKDSWTSVVLSGILSGEVHWCSGQSNLSGGNTPVGYAFNGTAEILASQNYPWIRLFQVGFPPSSDKPLDLLENAPRIPWSMASPHSVKDFSATCWFYGKTLADFLGSDVPIGLIESAWGGTSIQVWLPPESIPACGNPPPYPGGWPTIPSSLWNSMTTPFVGMAVQGMIWYQGESNSLTSQWEGEYYTCALRFLVESLRKLLDSPGAHMAVVQLAPWSSSAASYNQEVASLRQAQLLVSDAPSVNVSVITAVDGGSTYLDFCLTQPSTR